MAEDLLKTLATVASDSAGYLLVTKEEGDNQMNQHSSSERIVFWT